MPPKALDNPLDSSKTRSVRPLGHSRDPANEAHLGAGPHSPRVAPAAIGYSEPTSRQAAADPPARALQRPAIGPEARLAANRSILAEHRRTWIDNPKSAPSTGIREGSFQLASTPTHLYGLRCGGRSISAARKPRAPHITSKRVRPSLTTFLSGMPPGRASSCSCICYTHAGCLLLPNPTSSSYR